MNAKTYIEIVWAIFFGYWFYSGRKTKATASRESILKQFFHLTAMNVSFLFVLSGDMWPRILEIPIVPASTISKAIGVSLSTLGASLAIWARMSLGQNWSAAVSLKKEHEIIRSGPYKLVRHPIYTGILTNIIGSALITGEMRSLIAISLVLIAYPIKIRREEILLSRHFPQEYPAYAKKTWRLLPYVF